MTLANGGVALLELPDTVPQEIKDRLLQVEQDIVAGTIAVSAIGDAEEKRARLDALFPEA